MQSRMRLQWFYSLKVDPVPTLQQYGSYSSAPLPYFTPNPKRNCSDSDTLGIPQTPMHHLQPLMHYQWILHRHICGQPRAWNNSLLEAVTFFYRKQQSISQHYIDRFNFCTQINRFSPGFFLLQTVCGLKAHKHIYPIWIMPELAMPNRGRVKK